MGRLVIVVLVIVTVIVLWKAFGPRTWNTASRPQQNTQFPTLGRQRKQEVTTKGPDDDPDFLWNIKKERFKAQREAERREQEAVDRARRGEHWKDDRKTAGDSGSPSAQADGTPDTDPGTPDSTGTGDARDNRGSRGSSGSSDPSGPSGPGGPQEKKDGEAGSQG